MAAQLILWKWSEEMAHQRIKADLDSIKRTIGDKKIIKIQLWVNSNLLNGLIVTTDQDIKCKMDENSIIPIAKYYGLYTPELKSELTQYDMTCCVII